MVLSRELYYCSTFYLDFPLIYYRSFNFRSNPSYLISLLSTLYAVRSLPLWKEPRLLKWLQKTCEVAASSLDDSSEEDVRFGEKLWLVGGWPKGVAPSGVIRGAFLSGE